MAIMTGTNLLDSIIESTGAVINPVQRAGLIARIDQMIAAGTASKMALAAVVLNFSTDMRSKVTAAELIDGIEQNQTLIENAADDAAVDAPKPLRLPLLITWMLTETRPLLST